MYRHNVPLKGFREHLLISIFVITAIAVIAALSIFFFNNIQGNSPEYSTVSRDIYIPPPSVSIRPPPAAELPQIPAPIAIVITDLPVIVNSEDSTIMDSEYRRTGGFHG